MQLNENNKYTRGLLGAVVKLIEGIKTGNFDDALNVPGLSTEEGQAVWMLAKAMKKEYENKVLNEHKNK